MRTKEARLLIDALAFAADKHRTQRRKDPEASPYINHPIALARVLSVEGRVRDVKVLAAAVLHDTLEDTKTTYEELHERFGPAIAGIVREVTDDKTLLPAERKRLQIEHAGELSHRARLVKLADKISNLRDLTLNAPSEWSLQRRRDYFDWAQKVIDKVRGTNKKLERAFDDAYAGRP
ncbi:MAG TPA: HD domain-containing protein [Casimicrobiaceae bacterium]|nr:HD domain-containing protein [Casimicrobiaceae bacterium]